MLGKDDLKLSRFTYFIKAENGDYVGVLNALNLGVIIVSSEIADLLQRSMNLQEGVSLDELNSRFPELVEELKKQRIIVPRSVSELDDLKIAREHLTHSSIGILYLILTDVCNISCRYCYFEGAIPKKHKFSMMSKEIARRGVDLFARILPHSMSHGLEEPQIILYGGEPFLNWPVMQYILGYIDELRKVGGLPLNTSVTINTNGILVTDEMAEVLGNFPFVTIAISVDGPKEINDLQRVDHTGHGTFDRVHRSILLLRQRGLNVGLCCTLASHNIDQAEEILKWLHDTYGISSLGFNILIEAPYLAELNRKEYAERVADKLVSCFLIARERGIYEDRIMRKVNSFVNGQIYFYDCGGCGGQIVISPDGQVGVCQAYCGTKKYFTLLTDDFDPETHPYWQEWRMRSPINMPQCIDCIALGNCGGGCPYSADVRYGSIWNLDDIFCVFSRKVITFLVKDLIKQMLSQMSSIKSSLARRE